MTPGPTDDGTGKKNAAMHPLRPPEWSGFAAPLPRSFSTSAAPSQTGHKRSLFNEVRPYGAFEVAYPTVVGLMDHRLGALFVLQLDAAQ